MKGVSLSSAAVEAPPPLPPPEEKSRKSENCSLWSSWTHRGGTAVVGNLTYISGRSTRTRKRNQWSNLGVSRSCDATDSIGRPVAASDGSPEDDEGIGQTLSARNPPAALIPTSAMSDTIGCRAETDVPPSTPME